MPEDNQLVILTIDSSAVSKNSENYLRLQTPAFKLKTDPIYGKRYKPVRKVILTTSIAETGLTVDTLK